MRWYRGTPTEVRQIRRKSDNWPDP